MQKYLLNSCVFEKKVVILQAKLRNTYLKTFHTTETYQNLETFHTTETYQNLETFRTMETYRNLETYRFREHIRRLPGKVIHAIPLPDPEVTERLGARRKIGELCRQYGYKQVLLVTDKTLASLGFDKAIIESLEGVKLILENLPLLTSERVNELTTERMSEARLAMCKAAMFGGNAINTQLAGYVHAFAHSIGATYHLSHGQANTF